MKFRPKKTAVAAPLISAGICLLIIALYNFTFWQQLSSDTNIWLSMAFVILMACIFYVCLTLVSFRYVYKPFVITILFISAISAYAIDHFGFIISAQSLQNIFETHHKELSDLISRQLIFSLLVFFMIPAIIVARLNIKYPSYKTIVLNISVALLLAGINIAMLSNHYVPLIRNSRQARCYLNPARPIYSLLKFAKQRMKNNATILVELDPLPQRQITNNKAKLIVLVVGEANRAANQSLNGYIKNTNPLLAQREVYSFKNFHSCGTETSISVPCMFSAYSREDFTPHKARYSENILDLLQKTQVQILWLDNDGGCKHVCDRVPHQDFTSDNQQDEVLLKRLENYLQPDYGDKLVVLHMIGNHGPAYYKRYPDEFKQFTPTCDTNQLQQCSKQEIVNTYDNAVLYTDYFLNEIIKKLEAMQNYQTALIYVSDHGESLGENGIYLHGLPYWLAPKEQTQIPFFLWISKDFIIDKSHLHKLQQEQFSHDNLFHTLLGLYDVKTHLYNANLDMFALNKP